MRRLPSAERWLLGAALCAACSRAPTAPGSLDAASLCDRVTLAVQQLPQTPLLDDYLVALAEILPGGFGGSTVDFMYLVHPDSAPQAAAAIQLGSQCGFGKLVVWSPAVRTTVVKGDYDFAQLHHWRRMLEAGLDASYHAVLFDTDESRNRVVVGVNAEADVAGVEGRVTALGIPAQAVIVEVTPLTWLAR